MAKRKGALFEVLANAGRPNQGAGSKPKPKSAPKSKKRKGQDGTPAMAAVNWVREKVGKKITPAEAEPATVPLPGGLLAAVASLALLFGFLVGRWTASPGTTQDGALRRVAGLPEGREPIPLDGRQDQEEKLSQFGFALLNYPARDRARAVSVMDWLRERGLESTRLRRQKHRTTGEEHLLVVVYTDQDGKTERAFLGLLGRFEPPEFAPELGKVLESPPDRLIRFPPPSR